METKIKTPVEIVQELIAILTTRKEATEKLLQTPASEALAAKLPAIATQSDELVSELMNDLSNYGDAIPAAVDRENEYQTIWKNALQKIDTLNATESEQLFYNLEESLKNMYNQILETKTELPASLQEILSNQVGKLTV